MWKRCRVWAGGPKPPAEPPALWAASASRPPGGCWPLATGHRPDVGTVPRDRGDGPAMGGRSVGHVVMADQAAAGRGRYANILTEAIAEVMRDRFRVWAGGPKPPASTRPAGGGCFTPAGRALASRSRGAAVVRHPFAHRAGKRCAFSDPPECAEIRLRLAGAGIEKRIAFPRPCGAVPQDRIPP